MDHNTISQLGMVCVLLLLCKILCEALFVSLEPCGVESNVLDVLFDGSLARVEVLGEKVQDFGCLFLRVKVAGGERHEAGEQGPRLVTVLEHWVVGLDKLPSQVASYEQKQKTG